MKIILTILTVFSLAGAAIAGCGKNVEVEGKLKAYDADAKSITVDGSNKAIKLTAGTKVTGKDGKKIEITELEGKKVKVVHEHNKAKSVSGV